MPLPPAPDRRPLTQADKDLLFKGVTCTLIGAVILLAPLVARSPSVRELMAQAAAVGISRGSVHYLPRPVSESELVIMRRID